MSIKFIDLFAGIGGMRLAFEDAGGECILTCEINESALQTYKANFKQKINHIYVRNILKLEANVIPDHDILVAGFPCQPYSIAGLRQGLKDVRGGDIFLAILKILNEKQPSAFLLENVKGMISHDNGATFAFILKSLSRCGYAVQYNILNSMHHANIPQNRERVFIVGFKDVINADKFEYPKRIPLTKTIHDCLDKQSIPPEYYYTDRYDCYKVISNFVKSKDIIYQWRRQYVRENKRNVCPTLTANMGTGGHNVPLILDDFGIRKLTPREIANFQGFPSTFMFPNISNSKLYCQLGNSVTVPLVAKIAQQIIKLL